MAWHGDGYPCSASARYPPGVTVLSERVPTVLAHDAHAVHARAHESAAALRCAAARAERGVQAA